MFEESIQYFQSLIIRNRRLKKCTERHARYAWVKIKQLKKDRSFNQSFVHVLQDVALYGEALSYTDVIYGMSLSLKEAPR